MSGCICPTHPVIEMGEEPDRLDMCALVWFQNWVCKFYLHTVWDRHATSSDKLALGAIQNYSRCTTPDLIYSCLLSEVCNSNIVCNIDNPTTVNQESVTPEAFKRLITLALDFKTV